MKPKAFARSLIVAFILAAATASTAFAVEPTEAQREALDLKLQELHERLALTPDQEQKVAPILEERNAKLRDLWARHDPDSSRREKRALLSEAKAIQEDFTRQIQPILTKEQMREWEAFRNEMRAQAKERYRNQRN